MEERQNSDLHQAEAKTLNEESYTMAQEQNRKYVWRWRLIKALKGEKYLWTKKCTYYDVEI